MDRKVQFGILLIVCGMIIYKLDQREMVPYMEDSKRTDDEQGPPKQSKDAFAALATVNPKAKINIPWVGLPNFDEKIPGYIKYKESLLTPVRSQFDCASCWSMSVVRTLADRISLYTNGNIMEPLSYQEMISCWDGHGGLGCRVGGSPEAAYQYIIDNGVGLEKDYKYEQKNTINISPCKKENLNGKRVFAQRGSVRSLCRDPYRHEEGSSAYNKIIAENVKNMKRELYINGPFTATIMVHDSIYTYDGLSVYTGENKGKFIGGHSFNIFGAVSNPNLNGVEPGFDKSYWICSNSWGVNHPSKNPAARGFLYIEMGKNVCGVESRCSRVLPVITDEMRRHMVKNLDEVRYTSYTDYVNDPERENYIKTAGKIKGWYKNL